MHFIHVVGGSKCIYCRKYCRKYVGFVLVSSENLFIHFIFTTFDGPDLSSSENTLMWHKAMRCELADTVFSRFWSRTKIYFLGHRVRSLGTTVLTNTRVHFHSGRVERPSVPYRMVQTFIH